MKSLKKLALGVASLFGAGSAMALPVDLTTLTAAVDFSTATDAILVVAGALIVVYIAIKAAKFVIGMVRGA